jgi:hypothetical protein
VAYAREKNGSSKVLRIHNGVPERVARVNWGERNTIFRDILAE